MDELQSNDILANYVDGIKLREIDSVREPRIAALGREHWGPVRELFEALPTRAELLARGGIPVDLDSPSVRIGVAELLRPEESRTLAELIRRLVPWRKGPFSLFGQAIEAEWRSDRKWARIEPILPPLWNKRVLDVGCNNGYYLLRLLGLAERRGERLGCALGIDPSEAFCFAFQLFQRYLARPELGYELLGIEHASLFGETFDIVLCLGIVYHQRDPLSALQSLRRCMRRGGLLVLESQAIEGEEPVALFPPDRYAKMRNVYFVPTASCLAAWAERAGFTNVRVVSFDRVTEEEQRRTELAPYESLSDFLDPADPNRTVEGHPAPFRALVIAEGGPN